MSECKTRSYNDIPVEIGSSEKSHDDNIGDHHSTVMALIIIIVGHSDIVVAVVRIFVVVFIRPTPLTPPPPTPNPSLILSLDVCLCFCCYYCVLTKTDCKTRLLRKIVFLEH